MKIEALMKVMVVLFVIVSIINIALLIEHESDNRKLLEATVKQSVYKQLGIDLISASDLLSEQARCYTQNGDKVYYDTYINEVNNAKTRENVIEQLRALDAPQNEIDMVAEAVRISHMLEQLEMEAFEAIANHDLSKARQIMYSEKYAEGKQSIIDVMGLYQKEVDQRIKIEAKAINKAFTDGFMVRVVVNAFISISIIACLFAIIRFIQKDERLKKEYEKKQKNLEAELRETANTANEELSRLRPNYEAVKDRFERIVNTAQVAFLMSVDNVITEANEYSANNLGAKNGESILPLYAEPSKRDEIIKMIDSKSTVINVVKFNMKNGSIHRFLVNVSAIEYEYKSAYILWGIDIDQDEVDNDQIRVMQQSLQTVLDALPIPVRIVDLETKNIMYVNDSFLELLEYDTPDEMYALELKDILTEITSDGTPSTKLINMTVNSANLISFEVDYKTKNEKNH